MSTMPYRAVVTDLDGTLLNENHLISEYTAETLRLLREKNVEIIFATGRPFPDVFSTVDMCGLQGGYLITTNGARVFDPQRNVIATHDLDSETVTKLLAVPGGEKGDNSRTPLFTKNMYRNDEWLTNHGLERMLAAYSNSGFTFKEVDLQACSHDGVHAVFYVGEHESLLPVEEFVKTHLKDEVECCFSLPCILDVVRHGVHKGQAMSEVAKKLGINTSDIIAFGDGMNDQKMLDMAGKGCIMSNAQQRLKDALPHLEVIGSNREDGVAKKLREVFGL